MRTHGLARSWGGGVIGGWPRREQTCPRPPRRCSRCSPAPAWATPPAAGPRSSGPRATSCGWTRPSPSWAQVRPPRPHPQRRRSSERPGQDPASPRPSLRRCLRLREAARTPGALRAGGAVPRVPLDLEPLPARRLPSRRLQAAAVALRAPPVPRAPGAAAGPPLAAGGRRGPGGAGGGRPAPAPAGRGARVRGGRIGPRTGRGARIGAGGGGRGRLRLGAGDHGSERVQLGPRGLRLQPPPGAGGGRARQLNPSLYFYRRVLCPCPTLPPQTPCESRQGPRHPGRCPLRPHGLGENPGVWALRNPPPPHWEKNKAARRPATPPLG